jgi:adenylosuccinate lyase
VDRRHDLHDAGHEQAAITLESARAVMLGQTNVIPATPITVK